MVDYAIVKAGGKQHRIQEGDILRVESLSAEEGDAVELDEVLMVSQDGAVTLGSPTIPGAKVTAEVVSNGRAKKIVVFKYKPKTRNRTKNGHRQSYTDLKVTGISLDQGSRDNGS